MREIKIKYDYKSALKDVITRFSTTENTEDFKKILKDNKHIKTI